MLLSENTEQRRKEGQSRVYLLGEVCLSHTGCPSPGSLLYGLPEAAESCLLIVLDGPALAYYSMSPCNTQRVTRVPGARHPVITPDLKGNFSSQLENFPVTKAPISSYSSDLR